MSETDDREFRVHARHIDRHHARLVHEPTFEAAAVAYIESYAYAADEDGEVSVIVHDVATGHEHCFRVDLGTGETDPCC